MKSIPTKNIVLVILLSVLVTACAGKKDKQMAQIAEVGNVDNLDGAIVSGTAGEDVMGESTMAGPKGSDSEDPLGKRVIYFDYDSSNLTFEGESIAQAHGQYLADHPDLFITLEGHADERGTADYNLALAEDRAKVVSLLMSAYGVTSSRIQLVSYGEERPIALGHDEASYGINRRVEIIYQN